jgi:ribosomal-protein-alanine N-acetyltransferase
LILIPYTTQICNDILHNDFSALSKSGLKRGSSWPDADVMETLPRIVINLSKVDAPTGFESWMIIKKETLEIIGDLGFKGFDQEHANADLGYGIIKEERKNGYAEEAARTLLSWAFSTEIVREITARCAPDNLSSINLLRKLNFTETKRDNAMVHWSLLRESRL